MWLLLGTGIAIAGRSRTSSRCTTMATNNNSLQPHCCSTRRGSFCDESDRCWRHGSLSSVISAVQPPRLRTRSCSPVWSRSSPRSACLCTRRSTHVTGVAVCLAGGDRFRARHRPGRSSPTSRRAPAAPLRGRGPGYRCAQRPRQPWGCLLNDLDDAIWDAPMRSAHTRLCSSISTASSATTTPSPTPPATRCSRASAPRSEVTVAPAGRAYRLGRVSGSARFSPGVSLSWTAQNARLTRWRSAVGDQPGVHRQHLVRGCRHSRLYALTASVDPTARRSAHVRRQGDRQAGRADVDA